MQLAFDLGLETDLARIYDLLVGRFGHAPACLRREPMAQLVKSLLGSRTRDEVSQAAFDRLERAFPSLSGLATAQVAPVQALIEPVTFADVKAVRLISLARQVAEHNASFDLTFLGDRSVPEALVWLERLPGVGRKVSAATLNFSTLHRPAFVIDTHILRVLRRFGMVRPTAATLDAYEAVMQNAPGWSAARLVELHVVMKRLGQTLCLWERPVCDACPLNPICGFRGVPDAPSQLRIRRYSRI